MLAIAKGAVVVTHPQKSFSTMKIEGAPKIAVVELNSLCELLHRLSYVAHNRQVTTFSKMWGG